MKDLPRGVFVALAALVPIAFWIAHRELGHHADIAFFHEWYLAFRASDAFYRDGPGSNYPILGVLIVCGPSFAIEKVLGGPLELAAFTQVLKGTCSERSRSSSRRRRSRARSRSRGHT